MGRRLVSDGRSQSCATPYPLRVIEELDKYGYEEREKRIKKVARNPLPQLEQRLQESNLTKVTVNDKETIQVPSLPGGRDRSTRP